MILLTQKYDSKSSIRKKEIDYVCDQNSKIFDTKENIYSKNRLSYSDFFEICNKKYKNKICIIANSDIIFNYSIELVEKIIEDNMIIALTRWEDKISPRMEGTIKDNNFYSHSQDSWIFRAGTLNEFNSDFILGLPSCENRFAFEAISNKVKIINPALSIQTFHYHDSQIRSWKEKDRYLGSYYFPRLTFETKFSQGIIKKNKNTILI